MKDSGDPFAGLEQDLYGIVFEQPDRGIDPSSPWE
jgi:hypothetical protein